MATLTVRNLPPEVHDGLRRRAAGNRRSVEAEVREVLRAAVSADTPRPAPDPAVQRKALAELRAMGAELKARLPEGWSLVDELIAERRLEAAFETGAISTEERFDMLEKLHRFELWPAEVQAFAEGRQAARK